MRKKLILGVTMLAVFLSSVGMIRQTLAIKPVNSTKVLQQITQLAPEGKVIHSQVALLFDENQVVQEAGEPKAKFDHQWMYDNLLLGFDYKANRVFSIAVSDREIANLTLKEVQKAFKANSEYILYEEMTTQDNRYVLVYKHLNRTRVQFTFPNPTKKTINPHATSYTVFSGETY